jgi:hypothetical protein
MSALLVGYARCSTDQQDLTAQREALRAMGVEPERIYVDHGPTGTNRERPGLREALAACRAGDTLVVTKLDQLARSPPDARAIADELTTRQISLKPGRVGLRPHRRGRAVAVQRPGDGRGVRVRPDPAPYPRGHEGRQGQGPATRQAAQAQPPPGSAPGVAGAQRRVQHRRGGRLVRRWPLDGLPGNRTSAGGREGGPRTGPIATLTSKAPAVPDPIPRRDTGALTPSGLHGRRTRFHHGTTVEAATCGRRPWTGEGAIVERRRPRQRQRHRTLGGRERAAASPKPERPVAVRQASA